MDGPPRRHRSSTTTARPSPGNEQSAVLRSLIERLAENPPVTGDADPTAYIQKECDDLRQIRQLLIDSSDVTQTKDSFRRARGFETLLRIFRFLPSFENEQVSGADEQTETFELLRAILNVLSEALYEHWTNRRYFAKKVDGGGWKALEQALSNTGVGRCSKGENPAQDTAQEKFFSILFAFALGEDTLGRIFGNSRRSLAQAVNGGGEENGKHSGTSGEHDSHTLNLCLDLGDGDLANLGKSLGTHIVGDEVLRNPEIVPLIIHFWTSLRGDNATSFNASNVLSASVIVALQRVVEASAYNKVALQSTGVLSRILRCLFEDDLRVFEKTLISQLANVLAELGLDSLEDGYCLYRKASSSDDAADFLLRTTKASREPPHIQFDLSLHGHASVELPSLGGSFPPSSASSAGYTFMAWIRVDTFDSNSHTTIFGAFDSSETCFVLAYIEKDTRHFILQTSVTSAKPSVRFKSTVFQQGQWYHIALVHRRAKATSSSRAALYIDGEFTEQVRCHFPGNPPLSNSNSGSFASVSSASRRTTSVQAFLGTPQNLASRIGKNVIFSRWSLATVHLVQVVLSDELIAVYYRLGPRYNGNFQDVLGSFMTYRASAELSYRNDFLPSGRDDKSDIMTAIHEKARALLPESRVLLNISPFAAFDAMFQTNVHELQLVKLLSKRATKNLQHLTRSGGNSIAVNAAVPALNHALVQDHGIAALKGEPLLIVPQSLDDMVWRIGGYAAVSLKLVELAQTKESVLRAVEILFESMRTNWRNSEAMEKENGYGVLAVLLRDKMGFGSYITLPGHVRTATIQGGTDEREKLAADLLRLILQFCGYDEQKVEDSIIINPLGYRVLLVDCDTWRRAPVQVQKLYYAQFVHLIEGSRFHAFNIKRLNRARIVKRFLEAMKGETFSREIFPHFLRAFRAATKGSMSSAVIRDLCQFITYALQDRRAFSTLRSRSSIVQMRRQTTHLPSTPTLSSPRLASGGHVINPSIELSRAEMGISSLEMFTDLLCDGDSTALLKKFATTVTNRWVLHLLAESNPRVVVLGTKIIARLVVVHGPEYNKHFADKTGGFIALKYRLKTWWNEPALWIICFAVLLGYDVAAIDLDRKFDHFSLFETFLKDHPLKIAFPIVLPVITAMLDTGLRAVVKNNEVLGDAERSEPRANSQQHAHAQSDLSNHMRPKHTRQRSMSMESGLESHGANASVVKSSADHGAVLHTVVRFLTDLHVTSAVFRDFEISSDYVQELLAVLYPVIVSSNGVSAETELNSRDSTLTFEGQDVVIRPHSKSTTDRTAIIRSTAAEELPQHSARQRIRPIRRGSSIVMVSSERPKHTASGAPAKPSMVPQRPASVALHSGLSIVGSLVEVVVAVFLEQVFHIKDFTGFGLFLKVPPGFREHQAYFETYLLLRTMSELSNQLKLNQNLLSQPRVLTNLAKYALHMAEAVSEGWFLKGAEPLINCTGTILDHLQHPEIAKMKSVRLCSQAISTIRTVFLRIALLHLWELDDLEEEAETVAFLEQMNYWQTVLFSSETQELPFIKLMCHLLYKKLVSPKRTVQAATANLWRMLLVQKPAETATMLTYAMEANQRHLSMGFMKLANLDNDAFLGWVDEHRGELDSFFFDALSKPWEDFVAEENRRTEESIKNRLGKRKEKLKRWQADEALFDNVLHRHEISTSHSRSNTHALERMRHQKAVQDQQDNLAYVMSSYDKLDKMLRRPCGLLEEDEASCRWQLDETEGRNRMRMRILPDRSTQQHVFHPKASVSGKTTPSKLKIDTSLARASTIDVAGMTPSATESAFGNDRQISRATSPGLLDGMGQDTPVPEEDFEMVADPREDDGFEDKNRKVMRSLERGDQVQHLCNVSRIVGLEACEGLLVVGKDHLYLQDNFFQRSDGEIISVAQAPTEERDPYLQMISGRETKIRRTQHSSGEQSAWNWTWEDVISISKRRFLFRDVAIEVFFTDGRSYLLTTISPAVRNDLYAKLVSRAPHVNTPISSSSPSEDSWRLESLRNPEETPQTFGSKFANVFSSGSSNAATRKWIKGEISNFHYLMLVNTMAGRTFNDLTQYPVFPWVLADYTSEELDLNNPRTFRDLSKPMGCQHPAREADFRERYRSFAEMGDDNAPPFHYGTHYSSAMIVSSYLIRLPPFVQSYLLLQGGSFDHADRLFSSVEKAWQAASGDNMTDVRELTPEFFYLPEFLVNINGYNFGAKQATGEQINNVVLPPWAKGDPNIFIVRHREALESPHVSKHLHQWIDLVFGFKQRGEAALEATNVFHYLSYHGAKDLDNIEDPVERLATIGIIHNFGQTPLQIFQRSHMQREETTHRARRLDSAAESLTRLPFPLVESKERVFSLIYSPKQERLLCAAPLRLNIPPTYDRYMEWGFADSSIRFYDAASRKLIDLMEHPHQGQLSCATFVDSKTLITAGEDCTVSVWNVECTSKAVEITPRICLFGHRTPVTVLAISKAFSTFISASTDGQVLLWDLNRNDLVRKLDKGAPVECARINNITGHIVLCRGRNVALYTLNGDLLLDQRVCDTEDDAVVSCAFYEGVGNEWLERELVFTGHKRGVVNIWSRVVLSDGTWHLQLVKRLNNVDSSREEGTNFAAAITCILPMAQTVYTGDDDGRVYQWDCVQRHGSYSGR